MKLTCSVSKFSFYRFNDFGFDRLVSRTNGFMRFQLKLLTSAVTLVLIRFDFGPSKLRIRQSVKHVRRYVLTMLPVLKSLRPNCTSSEVVLNHFARHFAFPSE
ncbi:MAG: hypothetical protein ACTS46_00700 [Candidatus Hodgkinia cicadicola]